MNLVEVFNGTRVSVDEEAVARLVARVLEAEGVGHAELSVELVASAASVPSTRSIATRTR